MPRPNPSLQAFTRLELLAVVAAITLLALIVAPALATNKSVSERLVCFNNLRLIGRGMQIWAGDHNQQLPWWTPRIPEGGEWTPTTRSDAVWLEYFFVSNELVNPKILACSGHSGVKRAEEWLQLGSYRNSAVSYSLH